jgi:LAO/AO transport system kinase
MIRNEFEPNEIAAQIANGNRRTLSRAITLVESSNPDHRVQASELLNALPPAGHAIRIGLSGTPGVGKSTFIENFGLQLIAADLRVAVLAVDPSSSRSGGSILGDKTRMDLLSRGLRQANRTWGVWHDVLVRRPPFVKLLGLMWY